MSVIFPVQDSWVKLYSRCIVYVLDAFCLLVLTRIYICCIFFAKHTFQSMWTIGQIMQNEFIFSLARRVWSDRIISAQPDFNVKISPSIRWCLVFKNSLINPRNISIKLWHWIDLSLEQWHASGLIRCHRFFQQRKYNITLISSLFSC